LGNHNPNSGNSSPDSGNNSPGKGNDWQKEESVSMDINMVFTIPVEFCAQSEDVMELALGVEHVMFDRSKNSGVHMKSLFIQGHLDGTLVGHMLIDGGARINILSLSLFKKCGHIEGDLKHTNLSLSSFACDLTEAEGIVCKELMVQSKTMPTAIFVVDVMGRYNVLLG
jgi:hypothetical protein